VRVLLTLLVACADDPAVPLTDATRLERRLAAGDAHVYSVVLRRDDFFFVTVTQQGVDVAVELLGPRDRRLLLADGPNGPDGPEDVAVVARAAGVHRLEVRAASAGSYRLDVRALRPADDRDHGHAEALRLYAEAEELRATQDADSRRRARVLYEELLERTRDIEAPLLRARAERRRGQVLDDLGATREALASFESALALYDGVGNGWEVAPLLNETGSLHRQMGEPEKARESFERALGMSRELDNRVGVAAALNNLGVLHESLGEHQEALGFYDRALSEWEAVGNRSRAANTLHNLGINCMTLGRTDEALDFLRQALEIYRARDDRHGQAVTLSATGWTHALDGDFEGALAALDEALELRRSVGDRQGEAVTQDLRGDTYREMGDWAAASASYRRSLELVRETGHRQNEAHALTNLGRAAAANGEPEAALELLRESLGMFRGLGDLTGESTTLVAIAEAERRRGNLAAARARLEEAITIVESMRRRLQSPSFRTSYFATRYDDYGLYVDVLMDLGEPEAAFEAAERARARTLLESLAEVSRRPPPELEARERALRAKINAKEARRLRLLSETETAAAGEAVALEQEARTLLRDYEKLQGEIRAVRGPELVRPLSLREIRRELLDDDTRLLAYSLGAARSFLWVVSPSAFETYELAPRDEIEELARRVHELLPRGHERGFRRQVELATAALSGLVLAPAAERLDAERLVIVADGALQYVPFAALPIGGSPLIVEHEVVSLPSASVLGLLRRKQASRARAPKALAMVADPVFSSDDPRLSGGTHATVPVDLERSMDDFDVARLERLAYSAEEAEAILALVPAEEAFRALGTAASRTAVQGGALRDYRIVHFATHGLMNARQPSLSGIVLSLVDAGGAPQDGFLRVHEIPDLGLTADLVVLSACRTALGKHVRGEGLLGLTRGFFAAGTPRVVVSYWNVSDRATAELMARFYRGLLTGGLTASQALRAAQLSLRDDARWAAPYYWAAFTLQGEWR